MEEKARILVVVEDEEDIRLLIRLLLRDDPRIELFGEASSAQEAIELARSAHPGLIILDHSIDGDVMGLQAAPLLKEAAPEAKILLFTAFDLQKEAEAEPAVDGFLSKSNMDRLLPTVQTMLDLEPKA
ncbi:MAG TPA: response regulator [Mycobacteriales bacterium]|nr:response regulator [Mycobacteriales bacterium]